MTRPSEIGQEMDAERVPDMCRQWARERGLTTIPDPGVMHYIERLEDALHSIANNTCCSTCQEAKLVARKALALHELEGER